LGKVLTRNLAIPPNLSSPLLFGCHEPLFDFCFAQSIKRELRCCAVCCNSASRAELQTSVVFPTEAEIFENLLTAQDTDRAARILRPSSDAVSSCSPTAAMARALASGLSSTGPVLFRGARPIAGAALPSMGSSAGRTFIVEVWLVELTCRAARPPLEPLKPNCLKLKLKSLKTRFT